MTESKRRSIILLIFLLIMIALITITAIFGWYSAAIAIMAGYVGFNLGQVRWS